MTLSRFTGVDACADRLVQDYMKYGNICVAFDFDNTLYDTHNTQAPSIPACIELMRRAQDAKLNLVVWTVRDLEKDTEFIEEYLEGLNITKFLINDVLDKYDLVPGCRKPFFSLLLDDRAGLGHSMRVLALFLTKIGY